MKVLHVGARLFEADGRTDRQTDIAKLVDIFRKFLDLALRLKMKTNKIINTISLYLIV